MQTKRPQYAKLTRPKLYDAIPRERLFLQIDEGRARHRVTWVEGPPGAGKTTLVASYIQERRLPCLWFQTDSGDNDPATFFYYLGLAASALPHRRRNQAPLPLLTPEYLGDLAGFSRRFFRELFLRIGTPGTLVFDNFQEVSDNAALHTALVAGIDEVPEGVHLIVASRAGTPPHYARLSANRDLSIIDWTSLKLTQDEARAMLSAARVSLPQAAAAALHERSGGWAVGLVLLMEQIRRGGTLTTRDDKDSLQQVFAYFAGQLFDRASAQDQHLLLQLSFPSVITESVAREVTGTDQAVRLLDQLYRRHLFTDRRAGNDPAYQFHALFRAFLQSRAREQLPTAERDAIARHCAELMERSGQPDVAMPLYLEARDDSGAEQLLIRESAVLIAQGRWRVVVDWIEALPPERVSANPWLQHWHGTAYIGIDPTKARQILEEAYACAVAHGDISCQVQIAAGMVEAIFLIYAEFQPIDPWIPALEPLLTDGFRFRTLAEELRAQSALLIAATYRNPDHPGIDRCAQRVSVLIRTGLDSNLRVSAATHLALYGGFTGDLATARDAARTLVPLLEDTGVTVFRRVFAWAVLCWYAAFSDDDAVGDQCVDEMERISREKGGYISPSDSRAF